MTLDLSDSCMLWGGAAAERGPRKPQVLPRSACEQLSTRYTAQLVFRGSVLRSGSALPNFELRPPTNLGRGWEEEPLETPRQGYQKVEIRCEATPNRRAIKTTRFDSLSSRPVLG